MLDAVAASAESREDRAPRVWLRTESGFSGANRVDVTFGVTEDAFVLVGMVGRDGELHILHPTRSTSAHLVSASRNQRLENVFTGFNVPQFGTGLHMTAASLHDYSRNTGYAFAIASDRELDLEVLDELGWWATPDLARDFQSMSPRLFAHRVASLIVREGAQYSVDAASVRTGEYMAGRSALAYNSSFCDSGGYSYMHPLEAQSLIRLQLSRGCSVPAWAIRRYLTPDATPTGVRPRYPRPPVDTTDTSAVLQDDRPLNEQVRSHLDRRRAAGADSAAASERSTMLRAQQLRRQILEIERQRASERASQRAEETSRAGSSLRRPSPAEAARSREPRPQPAPERQAEQKPETEAPPAAAPPPARAPEPERAATVRRPSQSRPSAPRPAAKPAAKPAPAQGTPVQ